MVDNAPQISEIARVADVSTATVDRVLNNRPGVREKTRAKVQRAVEHLKRGETGVSTRSLETLSFGSPRIAFVINSSPLFSADIAAVVRSVAAEMGLDPLPSIYEHHNDDPKSLGTCLPEMVEDADGVVLIGRPSYTVNKTIDRITASGRPVIGATTDFPDAHLSCYIGMNQVAAGRIAGRVLGEMFYDKAAPVLMHIGRRSRTEDEREIGFRAFIREHFPELELREIFNRSGSDDEAESLLDAELKNGAIPSAILTTGSGLLGMARRLSAFPTERSRPFLLGYELLPWSEQLLRDGSVSCLVAANSRRVVEQSLLAVLDVALHGKDVRDIIHAPHLIFRENLEYLDLDWH
jgi:LacI family transcriptional regulator